MTRLAATSLALPHLYASEVAFGAQDRKVKKKEAAQKALEKKKAAARELAAFLMRAETTPKSLTAGDMQRLLGLVMTGDKKAQKVLAGLQSQGKRIVQEIPEAHPDVVQTPEPSVFDLLKRRANKGQGGDEPTPLLQLKRLPRINIGPIPTVEISAEPEPEAQGVVAQEDLSPREALGALKAAITPMKSAVKSREVNPYDSMHRLLQAGPDQDLAAYYLPKTSPEVTVRSNKRHSPRTLVVDAAQTAGGKLATFHAQALADAATEADHITATPEDVAAYKKETRNRGPRERLISHRKTLLRIHKAIQHSTPEQIKAFLEALPSNLAKTMSVFNRRANGNA